MLFSTHIHPQFTKKIQYFIEKQQHIYVGKQGAQSWPGLPEDILKHLSKYSQYMYSHLSSLQEVAEIFSYSDLTLQVHLEKLHPTLRVKE